ncbi:hypothetical protein Lser_V15G29437 [Lactuca serriola]
MGKVAPFLTSFGFRSTGSVDAQQVVSEPVVRVRFSQRVISKAEGGGGSWGSEMASTKTSHDGLEYSNRMSGLGGLNVLYGKLLVTETEEGIAQAIIKGDINFERDPWPRVSEDAINIIRGMLDQNPYDRLTVEEVLENKWIQNAHKVPNIPLGEHVRARIQQFSLMNKFKRKVIRVVAENLPDEQVHGLKQMFDDMDKDKNGSLTFEELKDGLCTIGEQPLADPDVQMLMEAADLDENGVLNCEEFMIVAVHLKRISNDDHLRQAFHHFDKDNNGYIEYDELRDSLFEEHQNSYNEKLVHDIIHDADLDKDGRISYPEFAAMMTTGMDWKMASRQYSRVMLNAISVKMFKGETIEEEEDIEIS